MTDPALAAYVDAIHARGETRLAVQRRIYTDPLTHMVAELLRRLATVPMEERDEAVLDATGAIMAVLDQAADGADPLRARPRRRMTADDYLRQGRLEDP